MLTGRVVAREVTGRLVFLTEDGIYEFDSATETFVQSPAFAALTEAGRRSFSWIAEDSRGDVWVASRKPGAVDVLRRQWDGRYVADTSSLLQMPAWAVYPEPDGRIVWLSVPDYLLRYDLSIQSRPADFTTLIRKVTVNDDTLVYGGASPAAAGSGCRRRARTARGLVASSTPSSTQSCFAGADAARIPVSLEFAALRIRGAALRGFRTQRVPVVSRRLRPSTGPHGRRSPAAATPICPPATIASTCAPATRAA